MREALARFLINVRGALLVLYALPAVAGAIALLAATEGIGVVILLIALVNLGMFLAAARRQPLSCWRALSVAVGAANALTFSILGLGVAIADTTLLPLVDGHWWALVCIWVASAALTYVLCRADGLRGCVRLVVIQLAVYIAQWLAIAAMAPLVGSGFMAGIGLFVGAIIVGFSAAWTLLAGIALLYIHADLPKPAGLCTSCGYDLRGLPEPRCPECGTPFEPEEMGLSAQAETPGNEAADANVRSVPE